MSEPDDLNGDSDVGSVRERSIGNGLRVTQSSEAGTFLHFKSMTGKAGGVQLDNLMCASSFLEWAENILSDQVFDS